MSVYQDIENKIKPLKLKKNKYFIIKEDQSKRFKKTFFFFFRVL